MCKLQGVPVPAAHAVSMRRQALRKMLPRIPVQVRIFLQHNNSVCNGYNYNYSGVPVFICPLCESEVLLEQCFRDKAVTMDLKKATITCTSHGCPWEGRSEDYKVRICWIELAICCSIKCNLTQDHADICKFAIIPCPHLTYGCQEQLPRSEMSVHVSKCSYRPVECQWCKKNVGDGAVSSNSSFLACM